MSNQHKVMNRAGISDDDHRDSWLATTQFLEVLTGRGVVFEVFDRIIERHACRGHEGVHLLTSFKAQHPPNLGAAEDPRPVSVNGQRSQGMPRQVIPTLPEVGFDIRWKIDRERHKNPLLIMS